MPIDTDDARLDQARFIALYLKLAQVQLGTLANTYDYHSIRRLIRVSGDDIEAEGEDPLGDRIVEGIHALPSSETDGGSTLSIDPPASMTALFQEHELARSLKPKLYVGFDLQDGAAVCVGCSPRARSRARPRALHEQIHTGLLQHTPPPSLRSQLDPRGRCDL